MEASRRRFRAHPAGAHPPRGDRRGLAGVEAVLVRVGEGETGDERGRTRAWLTRPATDPADGRTIRSLARPLVALLAVALVFRPQVIAIGPLLPSIQSGLGISHGVAGALSSIPVLCMGIFAPLAPALARRLGARWALAACAVLVIGFGLLRLGASRVPLLVLALTFGIGLGMGLAGPIFPLVVRHEMPARPALGTGAYAIGLVLGATVAAAVAVPLAG